MQRMVDDMSALQLGRTAARRGILPVIGLIVATLTSIVLWFALLQVIRWVAQAIF